MAGQHTPGPWRIVTDGISHWIEIEPNKISLVKANQADRSLIAAAPEMLEALEWLADSGEVDSPEALSVIRDAIAKAVTL